MASKFLVRAAITCMAAAGLGGIALAGAGSEQASGAIRKGDMIRAAQAHPRAEVASYTLSRGAGRVQVVMRTHDGREAFRADEEKALTVVARGIEVPPVPETSSAKQSGDAAKTSGSANPVRRGNPLGCERALSGLVRASAMSAARCLT